MLSLNIILLRRASPGYMSPVAYNTNAEPVQSWPIIKMALGTHKKKQYYEGIAAHLNDKTTLTYHKQMK